MFQVFSRLPTKNILLTKIISRYTCLCTKHQLYNEIESITSHGVAISANHETVCKNVTEDEKREIKKAKLERIEVVKFQV